MFDKLANDDCILGKVPDLSEGQVADIVESWELNKDGRITWFEFREALNSKWSWRL